MKLISEIRFRTSSRSYLEADIGICSFVLCIQITHHADSGSGWPDEEDVWCARGWFTASNSSNKVKTITVSTVSCTGRCLHSDGW